MADDGATATSGGDGGSLVVFGTTGRRVLFTKNDLTMPEWLKKKAAGGNNKDGDKNADAKQKKEDKNAGAKQKKKDKNAGAKQKKKDDGAADDDDDDEEGGGNWFAKQWDKLCGYWMNRVCNEAKLQTLTIEEVSECVGDAVRKRWEHRKDQKKINKKKKRLLSSSDNAKATTDDDGGTTGGGGASAAGVPSASVLLTNFTSFDEFTSLVPAERDEIVADVVAAVRKHCGNSKQGGTAKDGENAAAGPIKKVTPLIDDSQDAAGKRAKRARTEGPTTTTCSVEEDDDDASADEGPTPAELAALAEFDDRVGLVVELSSVDSAASVVAALHGRAFSGRRVMCKFH